MSAQLNPYLSFDGNAREAMEFYRSALGGDLRISTFGEHGVPGVDPEGVMHSTLTSDGLVLMASDAPEGMAPPVVAGNSVTCSLSGTDADHLRGVWAKLADGGRVMMPLEMQMWGDEYGFLTDRFGIGWHVDIVRDGA